MSDLKLNVYQADFLYSTARYPALVAGIGTGKTYMLLLKVWKYCQDYPGSLALIVRKEFTDLRDSTMKDFERYFRVTVDSNKEHRMPNGSVIMFRHASEIAVLKNINLSIFAIEQAEEFENEEVFTFLRDRLRRESGPYRQGMLIANANGHNWIWRLWVQNPASGDYDLTTATTFDNAHNLPADFIEDLKAMEKESPNHYKQYVLNSFEDVDSDDLLFAGDDIYASPDIKFTSTGVRRRILAVDVARFGDDETVFCAVESQNIFHWNHTHTDTWKNRSLMECVGKVIEMSRDLKTDFVVIDDTGVGGGVTDRLKEMNIRVLPFNGAEKPRNDLYLNKRSEGFFELHDLFAKRALCIQKDIVLQEQLAQIRFKFMSNGKKAIVSKDEMRKEGLKSPDRADALMMAMYFRQKAFDITAGGRARTPELVKEACFI